LIPELKITTIGQTAPAEQIRIIDLYHDHETSEPFHSELKNDMDIERMAFGKTMCKPDTLLIHHGVVQLREKP